MRKIFVAEHGSYGDLIRALSSIEGDRALAIDAAVHGDYSFSIRIFRRTVKAIPAMPSTWRSHKEVLQEIRKAMEESFGKSYARAMDAHNEHMYVIAQSAAEGHGHLEELETMLEEHAEDMESCIRLSSVLTHTGIMIDYMCGDGKSIQDEVLELLETSLKSAQGAPQETD